MYLVEFDAASTYSYIGGGVLSNKGGVHNNFGGVRNNAHILALRSLPQLCCLSLGGGAALAVTPGHVGQLLAALPQLHTFCCGFELRRDSNDGLLQAIGEACRQLPLPELWGEHNMADVVARRDKTMLFPQLRGFRVGRLKHWDRKAKALVSLPLVPIPYLPLTGLFLDCQHLSLTLSTALHIYLSSFHNLPIFF